MPDDGDELFWGESEIGIRVHADSEDLVQELEIVSYFAAV